MRMAVSTYINVKEDMKFQPTEQQLVNFFKMKMDGRDSQFIAEIDLYKYAPWELPALSVVKCSEEWFFFTKNSNKYITGNRSNRQTEKGYWKKTCRKLPVKTHNKSKVIGKKRIFVFHKGRASHERKTNWVMHEYFVPEAKTNLVLCRIKWNSEGRSHGDSNNSIACFDTVRRRTTEQGYWKITGSGRKIKATDNSIIGKMRIMIFYIGRAPNGHKTGWVIHQYFLLPNDNNQGDIGVCRLNLKSDDDNYVDDSATTCDEGEPSTKTASDFDVEDVPAQVHSQTEDSSLQPRMYSELGDALRNIECNELQSPLGDNDSPITEFLNTIKYY
ncbi:hypothetical protein M0R45_034028 [Rubus argutus]|uniref:NAC domain-containing protein n=1 Tax=Rubus argutus TaxID=59490 RepID=A0AAW1VPW4_RUBAR